ncbi:hypothetical protein, partial [Mesorhizobium sp. M7D.F.Ca.US.004.03.1.1]|uniref:hypothetical protein n=1 Tax=Mesorhizobium sp. M7D.F.Ca.US.004.03.1.1 TaxID=2496702 RepID=UPI0032AEDFC9
MALVVTVFAAAGAFAPCTEALAGAFATGVAFAGAGLAAFFAADAFDAATGAVGSDDVTTDSSVIAGKIGAAGAASGPLTPGMIVAPFFN